MKKILITGVSKGLGLKISQILLSKGYFIIGISRSRTEQIIELIGKYPNNFIYKEFDLSNSRNVYKEISKNLIGLKNQIHGYVNNAAIAYDDLISNLKLEPLKLMFNVNVFTPMLITKSIIRNMLFHKTAGSIVHISSISVHTGYKGLAMYAATKGAIEAFSKNTAREWGRVGIRSNSIVAGFMETNMSSSLSIEQKNKIYNRTCLRKATSIDSVANAVAFLLSDESSSITGQNIFVDSGTI